MALDRLMPSINASRPGMDHTSPSDRSISHTHAAFRVAMVTRWADASCRDGYTRLTLAVRPERPRNDHTDVAEGAADWLSATAKGPTRSFPADCSTGPPDELRLEWSGCS